MLYPAPVTPVDPTRTRALLYEIREATTTKPAFIVLAFDNTNYRTWFRVSEEHLEALRPRVGKRVVGIVRIASRKVADCATGGKYVEPVFGPPQRAQGRIVATTDDAFIVEAGGPRLHVTPTHPDQPLEGFEVGRLVTFDAMEGASFEPAG
ncbi:MAG: hypothetical protein AAF108_00280 [Planctomycetota bacterium]